MSAEFIWAIIVVVALLAGPFAALRAVTHYRMTAEQKRRKEELERQEKEEEARGEKRGGYW